MAPTFIAVPFTAVITEATAYKFPVPKEAQPSTSRFGRGALQQRGSASGRLGAGFGVSSLLGKTNSNSSKSKHTITRAVKITSAAFTPSYSAVATKQQPVLTTLNLQSVTYPANAVETHTIAAFAPPTTAAINDTTTTSNTTSSSSASLTNPNFAAGALQLNLRVLIDVDPSSADGATATTALTVSGPGTVALFGEEFYETHDPAAEKRRLQRKRARRAAANGINSNKNAAKAGPKFAKLPYGGGEPSDDLDETGSFGGDQMYDHGIIYD